MSKAAQRKRSHAKAMAQIKATKPKRIIKAKTQVALKVIATALLLIFITAFIAL